MDWFGRSATVLVRPEHGQSGVGSSHVEAFRIDARQWTQISFGQGRGIVGAVVTAAEIVAVTVAFTIIAVWLLQYL